MLRLRHWLGGRLSFGYGLGFGYELGFGYGLGRLVVVRLVQSVVHEGMLRRLLQRGLESLLGVFHRLRVWFWGGVAVDGEACEEGVRVGAALEGRVHPTGVGLGAGFGVVVGAGLLVGLRVVARLDVGVDRRGELLAGVVGHVTPSSPGPSWPSSWLPSS